jgi:hypothetical protein
MWLGISVVRLITETKHVADDTKRSVVILERATSAEVDARTNERVQFIICDQQRTMQRVTVALRGDPESIMSGTCAEFFREHPDL